MKRKQAGYALFELLIIVFILSLFTAISIAYYRNFSEQGKLDNETKQLITVLNLAAEKASAADLSPNPTCDDFRGYQVAVVQPVSPAFTNYRLEMNCAGTTITVVQRYTVQSGITITPLGTILFMPLSAGTDLAAARDITLTNTVSGKSNVVRINISGAIEQIAN